MDTELWPRFNGWPRQGATVEECLAHVMRDLERDIDGITPQGHFGLDYQLRTLARHGLLATFFVEGLCADAIGIDSLRRIVGQVQDSGQETQLHLHPEWLPWTQPRVLPGRSGESVMHFSEPEQRVLIERGLENLRRAGAAEVTAFRAGNYGANFATLKALAAAGIVYDSSYNFTYLGSWCGMQTDEPWLHPTARDNVVEFPVSFFRTWTGQVRHAQVIACSTSEMQAALTRAWREDWYCFVIVSHSFELIRRPRGQIGAADRISIERFNQLCAFLADNRDKFETTHFGALDRTEVFAEAVVERRAEPFRVPLSATVSRMVQQAVRRIGQ